MIEDHMVNLKWSYMPRLVQKKTVINLCHAQKIKMPRPLLIFSQSDYLIQIVDTNSQLMTNSADPDQLASSEANWSGSTLFAKAGYIWVQQDKGYNVKYRLGS